MKILSNFAELISSDDINIPNVSPDELLENGLGLFYFAIGIISVIVIIIAGLTMVLNGADPATVTKSKNAILFAAIGIVIVVSAYGITQFILGRF